MCNSLQKELEVEPQRPAQPDTGAIKKVTEKKEEFVVSKESGTLLFSQFVKWHKQLL